MHASTVTALLVFGVSCADLSSSDPSATSAYAGVTVTAELMANAGQETVEATVSSVTIRTATGAVLATAEAYEPVGSADEVVAVRVMDGYIGAPLIAVTTTLGGHRESTTLVTLYRFDASGRVVEPVFTGATVEVEGDARAEGSLFVLPGNVLHRPPHAELARLYAYDPRAHRYTDQ